MGVGGDSLDACTFEITASLMHWRNGSVDLRRQVLDLTLYWQKFFSLVPHLVTVLIVVSQFGVYVASECKVFVILAVVLEACC